MDSVWFKSDLAEEIMKNNEIFEQTHNIVTGNTYFVFQSFNKMCLFFKSLRFNDHLIFNVLQI